jgi:glutathione S-transferase
MITVHHLDNSRSQRVIWLLEELALSYEIIAHPHPKNNHIPSASLAKIHPLAKAPILCDGNTVIAETGAIFEYLIERYGQGKLQPPPASPERIFYMYWRHFSEASLMPYLANKLMFAAMEHKTPWPFKLVIILISKAVTKMYLNPNIFLELDYIEAHLGKNQWFAGNEFSAADILIAFPIEAVAVNMAKVEQYPNIHAFVAKICQRSAYVRAAQKGAWSKSQHQQYWSCLR